MVQKNQKSILIIVENLSLPMDRRVWMEALTLKANGYQVIAICPKSKGYEKSYECLDNIHIYRHWLPEEKSSIVNYLQEYFVAIVSQLYLACKIKIKHGFDVIHACNPPDLIFLIALVFKFFFKTKFIFDHHDLCPDLYISKFGRKGFFYKLLLITEKLTFKLADYSLATNESYKNVAIQRGRMDPKRISIVRSGPDTRIFRAVSPNHIYKRGFPYMVGYVGVMSEADGVEELVKAAHEIIVQQGRRDIGFCLIGKGPQLDRIISLSKELRVYSFMEFTGRVSDQELIERLSSCDIGVTPDPYNPFNNQSTMNKTMEYMALGLPLVQYDLLEGRRSAGDAALYAKRNDVLDLAKNIVSLLMDEKLRKKMGEIGRLRMDQELGWQFQQLNLLDAYDVIFKN